MIVTMSLSEPEFQAWNVSERQFPKDGTKSEQLKFLLNYAILAPSSHNTQPWLFKIVGDDIIELYADRTRGLPLVDPMDRALTISCGAALSHLLIAIRHFGYAYELELFPDSNDSNRPCEYCHEVDVIVTRGYNTRMRTYEVIARESRTNKLHICLGRDR
jgi:hypothetical protein